MLALPPSSSVAYSTYTAEGDLPADLLAGSRAVDATLFRTGDNGFRTEGSSMLSVVDSVVTQQGPDNWVSVGTSGINFINSISSASANFGLQSSGEGPVTIQNSIITSNTIGVAMYAGSANIVDSTIIGNESVGVFSYNGLLTNTLDIVNCDIVNNGTWGIQVFRDNDPVPNITNSTIANNGHLADAVAWGYDGGNIEFLADTATTTTITYCTIASPAAPAQTSLRVGRPGDSGSSPISITDSIISSNGVGTHPLEIFETGNIRVLNSAIVTDLGGTIVGSYTDLGGVIHYDPAFVDAAANDFDVQNTSYAAAGTKGTTKGINDLRGDASYLGGVAPAAIDLTAADGSNINFGLTNKGVAPPNSVGVINTGGATAAVSTTITGTDAADFGVVGDPVVIPPGQTAYVEFTFDPSSAGVKNATGTIDGPSVTAPSGGADVNLTGEGTAVQDWMLLEN
jgi:hypothetical protein